ncbi:MAG: flagellar hook-length control protein FliK [Myxococcaceae bacterium]|nr:flagellar hook-length control protein FliK [Myxococcaceae bacterium]
MSIENEQAASKAKTAGPELRLLDRRAFVGFPPLTLTPGINITDFALQIPDVTFPLNISGGATKYQKKKLDFGYLEVHVDAEVIARKVSELSAKLADLEDLKLHFRPGYIEGQARLRAVERAPFTFKVAFDGEGDKLAVYVYDVRFYAFSPTPASRLPAMMAVTLNDLNILPSVERRGANGFTTRVLQELVEQAAVGRGYKMPSLDQARLAEAQVSSKGLKLRFAAGGLPPPAIPDEDLLLTLEGARAFADAEELLAEGKLREAREAYLKLGDATEAHPFATERLLTLLVADVQAHELVLDIAASLQRRRDRSATALWADAVVRERRGENARAAERYLGLSQLARKNQEEAGAFFAAEAAARAGRDHAPQMAVKALHELLGIKPDHLPSLKALARASDQAKDRAGAIRAYRRLAALARDAADAADAHVQLARLCAQTEDDLAGARLHCEAALRLAPDHPDALLQLGELCFRGGEHLRAIKALDRLREVALGRHEVDRIGRANLLAGQVWEKGLTQMENALLRYREAVSLLPGEPEPLYFTARVAEQLGRLQESVAGYQQTIELAGPAPRTDAIRQAAHQSHHALARLFKSKLGEPARARDHLEAALTLDATDLTALDELLPFFRANGRAAELADACEKAAAVIDDPTRRSALWAEAGELYRGRLGQPEKAERLLLQALEADGRNRLALEGMLALAESRRDGGQLCRCLKSLAEITPEPKDKVRYLRRLAVAARDLAFDLDLAVYAYLEVLKVEVDDLPVLGELCGLQRRRADMAGLAWALERRAQVAENLGDKRLAAACFRELAQVLEVRLGRAGEALVALEKAARLFADINSLTDLAALSLRCERPLNARKALEEVLAMLPRHAAPERVAEIRARLGKACDLLGDRDAARENYALAFPLRRLDDELAGRLESLYADGGFTRELTDLWASRAQALQQAGRHADAAPLFFKSAQALLKTGDTSGAILRLNAALEAAPHGEHAGETLEAMAELELKRGERLEAAKLLARRAGLSAEARVAARYLLRAARLAQDTAREDNYLSQALDKDPLFIPARLRRVDLRLETDAKGALADLEAILQADPNDPDTQEAELDRLVLTRKAGLAALRASHYDTARRHLSWYVAHRPDDLDASLQLADLHRRAGAGEPLVDLLGELWPRLSGEARSKARREYTEGTLTLGRTGAAIEGLRSILRDTPSDTWAAGKLLLLLPLDDDTRGERLDLLTQLIDAAQADEKAELLARRAELYRLSDNMVAARADLVEAASLSSRPVPLLRLLAETARQAKDDSAELAAWKLAISRARNDGPLLKDAAERLLAIARSRYQAEDMRHAQEAYRAMVDLPLAPEERFEAFMGLADTARALRDGPGAESALLEASKQGSAPKRVEALLSRAQLLEERGARAEAVQSFEAALALAPRHGAATEGLKRNLLAVGDFGGLAEVLAAQAAQMPKAEAAPLYRQLAGLYLDQLSQQGPGEAALRRVVQFDAQDVESRRRLALLVAERGETEEATTLLEEAAELLAPHEAAEALREGVALAREQGDVARALRLARKAHAKDAARGDELVDLADLLYVHGALNEALPLQQAVCAELSFEDNPEAAEAALLRLADLAEALNDNTLAEKSLRRLHKERPLNRAAVERLASLIEEASPREALGLLSDYGLSLSASPRTQELLVSLARRAYMQVADVELASTLWSKAIAGAPEDVSLREERAQLLRDAGRPGELINALLDIAQTRLTKGDVEGALKAYEEEAVLAESLSRTDDALRTVIAMAELCEDEGMVSESAMHWRHAAELHRDAKLDLDAANDALEKSWELEHQLDTARMGVALAQRRSNREGEIDWLERTLEGVGGPQDRAVAFYQLARLHLGLSAEGQTYEHAPLWAPDQAEAALRQALQWVPHFTDAEVLLLWLLERTDRIVEVAAYFEDAAMRAPTPAEKAQLLLKAAALYKDRAQKPHEAAAALLAARAARPDDDTLTATVADLLYDLGRPNDAADFDAILLEKNPLHASYARHLKHLVHTGDVQGQAALLSSRAQKLEGAEAADTWLAAAQAFRKSGAIERASICEDQAFEAHPQHAQAFALLLERAGKDVRRQAELRLRRAQAVPEEREALLRQRAQLLSAAQEALLAAEAWEALLAVTPDDREALETRAELAAQAGGAKAAQPWDRRLLQVAKDMLAPELRRRLHMRLGHAALESSAYRDAVDSFEAAYGLDAEGPVGREALSLLSEAYARLQDTDGLYSTTVRLAQRSSGQEAEALYRRAVGLFDEPQRAVDALVPLLKLRPGDEALYAKGQAAFAALGRFGELLGLHERYAHAAGAARGAEALLQAADVAQSELGDDDKAQELRREAAVLDPKNPIALKAVVDEHRRKGDELALLEVLKQWVEVLVDPQGKAEARLEMAALHEKRGNDAAARLAYQAVAAGGASSSGYAAALEALERIATKSEDPGELASALIARADLFDGQAKADLLLRAAASLQKTGDLRAAVQTVQQSLAARASEEAFLLSAALHRQLGEPAAAAGALVQAAFGVKGQRKASVMLEAVQAWEEAGQVEEARELLTRLLDEMPKALAAREAAQWYLRFGAAGKAAQLGFKPAMDAGAIDEALALARAANEEAWVDEALWAKATAEPKSASQLVSRLTERNDEAGLMKLAGLLEKRGAPREAEALWRELFFARHQAGALEALVRLGSLGAVAQAAVDAPEAWVLEQLLPYAESLAEQAREALWLAAAHALPARRQGIWVSLAQLQQAAQRYEEAIATLGQVVADETDAKARAALQLERAELLRHSLNKPQAAVELYEKTLIDDAQSVAAVRALAELTQGQAPERFVGWVERLEALAGVKAIEPFRLARADAYEALGRLRDAYRVLAELPELPELIRRRARLAEELGLLGESLTLRERVAETHSERDVILTGYLKSDLVPFAVRLGTRMLDEGALTGTSLRLLAERLAPTAQGAELACRVWLDLLAEQPHDADGWTLFAEALRLCQRTVDAVLADGFGAALTASDLPAPQVKLNHLKLTPGLKFPALPEGLVKLDEQTMPRLHGALSDALAGLGAQKVSVLLDAKGGIEAWQGGSRVLVLGVGALTVFGAQELTYLAALALAMGEDGRRYAETGVAAHLAASAVTAFDAYPASLAACRVISFLDSQARQKAGTAVNAVQVLGQSEAFVAIAKRALERLRKK